MTLSGLNERLLVSHHVLLLTDSSQIIIRLTVRTIPGGFVLFQFLLVICDLELLKLIILIVLAGVLVPLNLHHNHVIVDVIHADLAVQLLLLLL